MNNVEMAHATKIKMGPRDHASFDKNVFYKQHPDIIIPFEAKNDTVGKRNLEKTLTPASSNNHYLKSIFDDEKFKEECKKLNIEIEPVEPEEDKNKIIKEIVNAKDNIDIRKK